VTEVAGLVVSIVVCFAVAGMGSAVTRPNVESWLDRLERPSFAPPNWLFAPVWTLLFLGMAIAAWLVWRQGLSTPGVVPALAVFGAQLGLNLLWSTLFFGMRRIDLAFVEVFFLWGVIAGTIALFAPLSTVAAWLLVPYLAWVSFAAVLTGAYLRLNPRSGEGRT